MDSSLLLKPFFSVIDVFGDSEEFLLVLQENVAKPLAWALLPINASKVTGRIRKNVLHGEPEEALRLKESYRDSFALQAVSVRRG
jgi:hypothetical protein